jgi:uncharacterized membrane protein
MTEVARVQERVLRPIATDYKMNWKSFAFWRNAFILYWIFALTGHFLEYVWAALPLSINGMATHDTGIPLLAVAAPYGLGALAMIWVAYPVVARGRIGFPLTYLIGVLVATAIEFVCAAVLTLFIGYNPFWDYSGDAYNLFGFICLRNSLAFGLVAIVMLYWVFPFINNWLNKVVKNFPRMLNAGFWVLFVSYSAIQVWTIWFR